MNPFDWSGPVFLLCFVGAFAVTTMLNRAIKRFALRSNKKLDPAAVAGLDHYEVAYLSGGARAAVDAAAAALIHAGRVDYDRGRLVPGPATARSVRVAPGVYRSVAAPFSEHPLEQAVQRSVVESGRVGLRRLRSSVAASTRELAERLSRLGFTIAPRVRALGFAFGIVPVYLLILAGIIKIAIGASRYKPVGLLVVLLIAVVLYASFKVRFRFPRRTENGDVALEALRRKNAALRETAVSAPQQLHAHEAALGYALFGSAVLAGGHAELGADIQQLGSGVDDDLKAQLAAAKPGFFSDRGSGGSSGDSSFSGSVCGGSSCGGGGCGGGGCGGCGG